MCIYIHIYTHIHMYIYMYIHIYTYTHTHTYIYTHIYIHELRKNKVNKFVKITKKKNVNQVPVMCIRPSAIPLPSLSLTRRLG